jgi:hypothetical protein
MENEEEETNLIDAVDPVLGIADIFSAECITNYVGYHHHEDADENLLTMSHHFQDDPAAFEIMMRRSFRRTRKEIVWDTSQHKSPA